MANTRHFGQKTRKSRYFGKITAFDENHGFRDFLLSLDMTVNDFGHISRSLDCFTSNFSKTVCDTAKVTIDKLIGNHTLAFDWCHF